MIVRSVRYDSKLYEWLARRGRVYKRSVQKENTYLLERLRQRPDLLRQLEESTVE